MTIAEDWATLVPRLEADLRARQAGDRSDRDDAAWVSATFLLLAYSRVLAHPHYGIGPAEIDDLVQETLLKLQSLQTLQRLKITRSPAGYVAVMLRNAATDLVRRRRRGQDFEIALSEESAEQGIAQPSLAFPERSKRLQGALRSLGAEDRNLLRMRFWRGLTIGQIASLSHTTYSATAVRLFRILRKLRETIGPNL